ncbi:MAG: hypothetical protein KGI91_07755 [Burkholderiales bacterium]|nr:hypothetical protein [Burkholderiales bacterium]
MNRRDSLRRWTPSQVLREAKAGRLPVCFDFAGSLVTHSVDGKPEPGGVIPRILDFDGVVRSLNQPTTDGLFGFAILVEILEANSLKFSHKDGKRSRGIDLPTEFSYGGPIKAGHTVECWLEDVSVLPQDFLFCLDDLAKLVLATLPKAPILAPVSPGTEHAGSAQDAPTGPTVWTAARIFEVQAYRDQHGLKKTALHYKVSQTTISNHTKPKKSPTASPFAGLGSNPR